jgi:hypothetical protein
MTGVFQSSEHLRSAALIPCVGIFWLVDVKLVADRSALIDAEPYGDFLTTRGHYEVWEMWRRKGERWLRDNDMPIAILMAEYEEYPRGRIVYDVPNDLFTIYADRRLQGTETISAIVRLFGLENTNKEVRSDSHYR